PGAALGDVEAAGSRSAFGARREQDVGRARVADAVTGLCDVAVARRGPAHVRALRVRRARRVRPGAELGHVTRPGRRPALDRGWHDVIQRAARVGAGAELGDIAVARRRPALDARREDGVCRAVVIHSVAGLGDVAGPGRGPADIRALRVGRAIGTRSGADAALAAVVLREVVGVVAGGVVVEPDADAVAGYARVGSRALVAVVARGFVGARRTDAGAAFTGVVRGAGVPVVARGALEDPRVSRARAAAAHVIGRACVAVVTGGAFGGRGVPGACRAGTGAALRRVAR